MPMDWKAACTLVTLIASIRDVAWDVLSEAIKYQLERPFSPRRRAEQRAVVDPHHEPTSARLARHRAICAGPARCEHRRMKRGAGASVFGYFWGNCQK